MLVRLKHVRVFQINSKEILHNPRTRQITDSQSTQSNTGGELL